MNLSKESIKIYEDLLSIQSLGLKQIQYRSLNQEHAVWKSLLKLQASNRIVDHLQAIKQLKLAKSQISIFARSTTSAQNEKIYRKIMVGILSHLVNRQFVAKRFKQSLQSLKELCQQFISIQLVKQAIYNIFGLSSLVAIDNYNIQSNAQFKYPAQAQASFFYIVGKVKMVSHKINQVKMAYQKVLMLRNSIGLSPYILIRILDYLAEVQPVQYRNQYQKIKANNSNQNIAFTKQQKQCSIFIIKSLLQKQYEFSRKKNEGLTNQRVTKQLLLLYLNNVIKDENMQQIRKQTYFNSLLSQFQKQNNPTILSQMLQNNSIAKQAKQHILNRIQKVRSICLKYYFRKLLNNGNIKHVVKNSNQSSNSINNFIVPKTQNSAIKSKKQRASSNLRSIPRDLSRAKQILKRCIRGSNLIKINYGNTAMKSKFVKVEQKQLVWADQQKQIQFTSSKIKWKHILGIVYGKVSENLMKSKFDHLAPWRCFSLITNDRSFDFYCQNESQIFFWLQGISYQLQIFHKNTQTYPFYSKGRALWKMAIMKMNSKFQDKTKKYKCLNAGAVLNYKRSMQIITK